MVDTSKFEVIVAPLASLLDAPVLGSSVKSKKTWGVFGVVGWVIHRIFPPVMELHIPAVTKAEGF